MNYLLNMTKYVLSMNDKNNKKNYNNTFNEIKNNILIEQKLFKKPDAYKNINSSSFYCKNN